LSLAAGCTKPSWFSKQQQQFYPYLLCFTLHLCHITFVHIFFLNWIVKLYVYTVNNNICYLLFLCRLVFGTLYPAYRSYKAIKNKDVREYVSDLFIIRLYYFMSCLCWKKCI